MVCDKLDETSGLLEEKTGFRIKYRWFAGGFLENGPNWECIVGKPGQIVCGMTLPCCLVDDLPAKFLAEYIAKNVGKYLKQ